MSTKHKVIEVVGATDIKGLLFRAGADEEALEREAPPFEQPALSQKASFIYVPPNATNPLFLPTLNAATGRYEFILRLSKDLDMPIIVESTDPLVRALVERECPGIKLLAYDSLLAVEDIMSAWGAAAGKPAKLVEVTTEFMHGPLGIPWEVLDALPYIIEFGYMGGLDNVVYPSD
ncbi:hypothetical protein EYZ11_002267 [Aspergillus tanneri]|uniref:Uncharacterized protein n=1 Tax=Aspergillus tanneri TaxID=1220188 RepID=A0A4S3JRN7_9EURO|nr:uncharacterized protein ATNIH1004_001912 [Aspergillus tanneri]KAA8641447.1 hypothetical protein ATNIH1004_001912 [Aspergillus tanneri]THC98265.1 hypothetical protein EYZ11_002267 [Aspergillus tanneri]